MVEPIDGDHRDAIFRAISKMLDNPDEYGIYPTTACFDTLEAYCDSIRARTLAECKAAVEEIVLPMMETGIRSNTGIKILALFDKGGPLDPDTTHGKDQPCESK